MAANCRHGIPDDIDGQAYLMEFQYIHVYIKKLDEGVPKNLEYKGFVEYFQNYPEVFKQTAIQVLHCMAITAVVEPPELLEQPPDWHSARCYEDIAMKIKAVPKLGGDIKEALKRFQSLVAFDGEQETGLDPLLREYYQDIKVLASNHSLWEYLRNLKTCECIQSDPSQCEGCDKAAEKLLRCGQCRQARYCDMACQKKAWKTHKRWCTKSKHLEEILNKIE